MTDQYPNKVRKQFKYMEKFGRIGEISFGKSQHGVRQAEKWQ